MSKTAKAFEKNKAFIPFITCGYPSLEKTKEIVLAAARAGADLIELGIPFSDPTAEGPVIMEANERALLGGVTTSKIFDMVKEIRKKLTDIPLAFMTYANVVYAFEGGIEAFLKSCKNVDIDALILPDVPFEEKEEFDSVCRKYDVDLISLIAPTSEGRISDIARDARGFIYVVSSLGVTGVRTDITTDIGKMVGLIREAGEVPCAVGFGISTPDQAKKMSELSDGAIVGSAIIKIIKENEADPVPAVEKYIKEMAEAVHGTAI